MTSKSTKCKHFVNQIALLPYKVSILCFTLFYVKYLFNVLFLQMKNALILLFIFTKQNSRPSSYQHRNLLEYLSPAHFITLLQAVSSLFSHFLSTCIFFG